MISCRAFLNRKICMENVENGVIINLAKGINNLD